MGAVELQQERLTESEKLELSYFVGFPAGLVAFPYPLDRLGGFV
jgi:hypothetical protein